jgi:hypothetical protein
MRHRGRHRARLAAFPQQTAEERVAIGLADRHVLENRKRLASSESYPQ